MTTTNNTTARDNAMARPIRQRNARRFYGDSQESPAPRRIRIRNPRVIRNLNVVNVQPVINHDELIVPLFINAEIQPIEILALDLNVIDIPNNIVNANLQLDERNDYNVHDIVIPNEALVNIVADVQQMFNEVVQLDVNMAVESVNLKNDLDLAASGIKPIVPLCNQPAMRSTMNTFVDGIFKNVLKYCIVCKENWFREDIGHEVHNECLRCTKERIECTKKM